MTDINKFIGLAHDGDWLVCPWCGGLYLHHSAIKIWSGNDEGRPVNINYYPTGWYVNSKNPDHEIEINRGKNCSEGNPSMYRDGLTIDFACEDCHGIYTLKIWQHKGGSYIQWDEEQSGSLDDNRPDALNKPINILKRIK